MARKVSVSYSVSLSTNHFEISNIVATQWRSAFPRSWTCSNVGFSWMVWIFASSTWPCPGWNVSLKNPRYQIYPSETAISQLNLNKFSTNLDYKIITNDETCTFCQPNFPASSSARMATARGPFFFVDWSRLYKQFWTPKHCAQRKTPAHFWNP